MALRRRYWTLGRPATSPTLQEPGSPPAKPPERRPRCARTGRCVCAGWRDAAGPDTLHPGRAGRAPGIDLPPRTGAGIPVAERRFDADPGPRARFPATCPRALPRDKISESTKQVKTDADQSKPRCGPRSAEGDEHRREQGRAGILQRVASIHRQGASLRPKRLRHRRPRQHGHHRRRGPDGQRKQQDRCRTDAFGPPRLARSRGRRKHEIQGLADPRRHRGQDHGTFRRSPIRKPAGHQARSGPGREDPRRTPPGRVQPAGRMADRLRTRRAGSDR